MIAAASFLLIMALSMLVVRIGAVALTMTGLSEHVAQFQALSAYSGAGFTTAESESVVSHPARRRVISVLVRLGSAGMVTAISTLMLSLVGGGGVTPTRMLVMLAGVAVLVGLSRSRGLNRALTPLIERWLARYTKLDLRDYADLLHLRQDYRIVEMEVSADSWLARSTLAELDLPAEGVLILGVVRPDGEYVGAPAADFRLDPGDRILIYGRAHRLEELSERRSGDEAAHGAAKSEHERDVAEQQDRLRRKGA